MSERESFWLSKEGVTIRLEDLAHDFTMKSFNGALKGYFKDSGFKKFVWVSVVDEKTCTKCEARNGKEYKAGWFLPRIPVHPSCRCMWDILIELE